MMVNYYNDVSRRRKNHSVLSCQVITQGFSSFRSEQLLVFVLHFTMPVISFTASTHSLAIFVTRSKRFDGYLQHDK